MENIDSGSGTSDPDFIFTALEGSGAFVPELSSVATRSLLALVFYVRASRSPRWRIV